MSATGTQIRVIAAKEIVDNVRDRRSMGSTVLYALLGPFMILMMIVLLGRMLRDEREKPLSLPVEGREHAPSLVQFLEQNNVILLPAPSNPEAAVRNSDVNTVLIIPEGYGQAFREGRPAAVELVIDASRASSMTSVNRVRSTLQAYSTQIGALRLLARGINPSVSQALNIQQVDVSTPQSQAFLLLNMLPYFLIMTVFLGGTAVIIDATAGERERSSLEPLLINPVPRWAVVLAKLLASLPFAICTVLISLIAFGLIFRYFPIEHFLGMRLTVDLLALSSIFIITLPMILLASALQMIIATFAHTFKEAQTYVNWLPLIPALPGMVLAFVPVKPTLWTMAIPTFGQQILINQLIRGEAVSGFNIFVSAVVTLAISVILVVIAIRLYRREQILFGSK